VTRVPTAHALAHGDDGDDGDGDDGTGSSLRERPIDLLDIGRLLGESANVQRLGESAPIRRWRDDLTLMQEALSYARTILAADVAILSQTGASSNAQVIVDDLSSVLTDSAGADAWPGSADGGLDLDMDLGFDEGFFTRADHLLALHHEMAGLTLSSSVAVARLRGLIEEQLAVLTERQAAVEARLQQIRVAIIRRYRDAATPVRDQPA
jgi:hypothetical protein